MQLLVDDDLPAGWRSPRPFLRLVDRGLTYFEPWHVLAGSQLRAELARLRAAHPARVLVLFARREDRGDVACWDASSGIGSHRVLILPGEIDGSGPNEPAPVGDCATLPDTHAWSALAVVDMLAHDDAAIA